MLSCLLSAKYCCGIIVQGTERSQSGQCTCLLPHFFGQESSVFGNSETFGTRGNQEKNPCKPWEDQTIQLSALFGLKVL